MLLHVVVYNLDLCWYMSKRCDLSRKKKIHWMYAWTRKYPRPVSYSAILFWVIYTDFDFKGNTLSWHLLCCKFCILCDGTKRREKKQNERSQWKRFRAHIMQRNVHIYLLVFWCDTSSIWFCQVCDIYNALNEFSRVKRCKTAKMNWNELKPEREWKKKKPNCVHSCKNFGLNFVLGPLFWHHVCVCECDFIVGLFAMCLIENGSVK